MNGRPCLRREGFTLVEVLIFVAVLSLTATAGFVALNSTRQAAQDNKLSSDTAHVNEVLQIYLANGGTLPATSTIQASSGTAVVSQLKSRADDASAASTMGLTGSVLDARVYAVVQTPEEAATSQTKAVWNATDGRFELSQVPGTVGIKEFRLEPSLAAQTPSRDARDPNVLAVNTNKEWIWDYTDNAPAAASSGTTASTGARGAQGAAANPSTTALSPPGVPSGTFSLMSFNGAGYYVTLLDGLNPAGVSQIYYATSSGGSYTLYTGSFAVNPGTTISAYSKSIDPDRYSDSVVASGTIKAAPVTLQIGLAATSTLTYAQAGGPMTSSSATAPSATVTLTNSSSIPVQYQTISKIQTYYGYNGASMSAAPTMLPSISLGISQWTSGSNRLTVQAQLRTSDTTLFANSSTATVTVTAATTTLPAPSISPASGQVSTAPTVTISLPSVDLPVGARIFYTLDSTTPTTSSTLYSGPFTPTTGASGSIVVTAAVFGPAAYNQWFTQSSNAQVTYTVAPSFPDGALVGNATLNGTFVGSLMYAAPTTGSMNSIQFNSGAQILNGNLYLPGQPTIRLTNGTTWSTATDSSFSAFILGYEFDSNGNKTVQTTPRVLDETGSITPNNYTVTFNKNSILEGKVIRRHTPPAFPTVAAPPAPDSSNSVSLNTHPTSPINASGTANITNNTSAVGDVSLNAGHFGNLIANNGTSFVLGDPLHPDVVQTYSMSSLTLNSGASIKVVGKVILTVAGNINISSGSVLGNSSHSDWLQLQMSSSGAQYNANSSSYTYAELVVPTGSVTFNSGSIFQGSVTALSLTINSNGVVFDQPPVIQN